LAIWEEFYSQLTTGAWVLLLPAGWGNQSHVWEVTCSCSWDVYCGEDSELKLVAAAVTRLVDMRFLFVGVLVGKSVPTESP
jgi:hypothetical protein